MCFLISLFSMSILVINIECFPSIEIPVRKVIQNESKNMKPFAVNIIHIPKSDKEHISVLTSAIILTENFEDINEFNMKAVLINDFAEKLKFIVVSENSSENITLQHKVLNSFEGYIIQFEFFLANKPTTIELSTFEYFPRDTCTVNQTLLNTFNKETQKWVKILKFEEKFIDFNNCEMPIEIWDFGSLIAYYSNNELKGLNKDVGDILGKEGNFKPIYVREENFNETSMSKRNFLFDLRIGYYSIHNFRCCHITKTFQQCEEYFIIPQSEAYNSYEKLIMPFDDTTWYLLILTFSLAFIVIFIARYTSQSVRNRIFGTGIHSPAFNVVGAFFGIGQVRLPVETVPRFILTVFIFFCLIIRTAYQGVLFDMMTKDMRKPLPKTIADLYTKNFTIVVDPIEVGSKFSYIKHLDKLIDKSIR
jgi:hypothetical protein